MLTVKEKRNMGLDLMRFVCMFMVISLHYFGEGGGMSCSETSKTNVLIGSTIVVFCRGAVNCFFMNSGYFLNSNGRVISFPESFSGAIKLYRKTWIYSIVVFVIAVNLGISSFSFGSFLRSVFPLMGNQYWYITVFMLIALLKPFLARATYSMKDGELKVLVTILLCFDALQAAFGVNVFNEQGNGFLHAITMVMVGYSFQRKIIPVVNRKWAVALYFIARFALRGSGMVINRIHGCPISYWENLMIYNSPFVILLAYAVFCFFINTGGEYKLFSKISESVLAAYLIQDHSMMRENFWKKVICCGNFYDSNFMIVHYLISVFIIMIISVCIDMTIKTGLKYIKFRIGMKRP